MQKPANFLKCSLDADSTRAHVDITPHDAVRFTRPQPKARRQYYGRLKLIPMEAFKAHGNLFCAQRRRLDSLLFRQLDTLRWVPDTYSEPPYRPSDNLAERFIGFLRRAWKIKLINPALDIFVSDLI